MMETDEIRESLKGKALTGDIEAVKALMEYGKVKNYTDLIKGMDDDESAGETSFPNQLQLN